ncbi:hypothetical protein [Burkholderia gladioli]|uniref:Uncharacterized protein n=1 Tax=Burkholderia gladioli TaxID=28095 RepID=A0AAW3F0Z5_BURGA|nr:hypothetical protein [Burkholderia gladioli]AJW94332.1 hypothetical protein BM43_6296 [Burkholderia gladioli]KGC13445.1 hypothetical protein DM48_1469 [Burkholderia gladioli]MDJ1166474.1 hypothetical protein [Burkholderia gladioli pv. gladioli]MDN7465087.1 hypothetical protein [Burkholderia gladioli]MDN7720073.1 hypothetical protein [Burkholderia gladioli]
MKTMLALRNALALLFAARFIELQRAARRETMARVAPEDGAR